MAFLAAANNHSPPELEVPYYKEGNILDRNRRFPNANKLLQITQLAVGISYLHGEGVEHGNISPVCSFVQGMPLVCRLTISAGKHFDQGRWWRLHL